MQFHATLQKIDFDSEGLKKALHDKINVGVREAARAWLRAVLQRVPVYTGTARGTLIPLGSFLRVAIPIKPIATRKNQGPGVGAAQSLYEFLDGNGGKFGFTFVQGLEYYLLDDFNLVANIPSTPWHSFDSGKAAYDARIALMVKRLPKVSQFVSYTAIHAG